MKRVAGAFIVFLFLALPIGVNAYVNVSGYFKSNGTYVAPYVRSNPNGLKYDNYGYKPSQGLYNPTYGTKGSYWDTPTYITDPDYYVGKYLYDIGSTGSGYSYPSVSSYSANTPTCPLDAYYDGSSCKCNSGYVNDGGSCIYGNSYCWQKIGYMSSFDSLSGNCKCGSGYSLDSSGQCKSNGSICTSSLGLMSRYNSLTSRCECLSGYTYDGSTCAYKSSYSTPSTYSAATYNAISSCPQNSHISPTDSSKCQCDSSYVNNVANTGCILKLQGDSIVNNKSCTTYYGDFSVWDGTKTSTGLLNCGCQSGYHWNVEKTSCVVTQNATPQADFKSQGESYFITNRTCIGLTGDPYSYCVTYALNH